MTTRTSSKEALKEDIKNVLEELWGAEEEEPLYKYFTRELMEKKHSEGAAMIQGRASGPFMQRRRR